MNAAVPDKLKLGRRVALVSIAASALLAVSNVIAGLLGGSTSVVAAGLEFAGDVIASTFVYLGMLLASRPADDNHPYGHGRFETLTGLAVGLILAAGGLGISYRSLQNVTTTHDPPQSFAAITLAVAVVIRGIMATVKFRIGRRIQSTALVADAWNDSVDILSALIALAALWLTLYNPRQFLAADHYGGFAVGLAVVLTGMRVIRDTSMDLLDTMPGQPVLEQIRAVATQVPGVMAVEKCYARKTGLQYHVDLHLEVDPNLTVWESHDIATQTRIHLRQKLDWVADVLVHIEPYPGVERRSRKPPRVSRSRDKR